MLTLNWQDTGSSAAGFQYYDDNAFMVKRVHPLGGPAAGGTLLTVYLYDDRLLVDLGGEGTSGLRCRFSGKDLSDATEVQQVVAANTTNCKGARWCGYGWGAMACVTPSWAAWVPQSVVVEVSINGHDFSSGGQTYDERYHPLISFILHDPQVTRMDSFLPVAGPFDGGTVITVSGGGFARLGDVRCRFGTLNTEANASVLDAESLVCHSPRSWMVEESAAAQTMTTVRLQVTLNGQQYFGRNVFEERDFSYFALDRSFGLSVRAITPSGGSAVGATPVTVLGSGFLRGTWATKPECRFGEHGTVPASIVTVETMTCVSPPRVGNESSPFAIEVGIVGEAVAFTAAEAALFSYHAPSRLHTIYPLGGDAAGGTLLTMTGSDLRELDHGHGLQCLFGRPVQPSPATEASMMTGRSLGESAAGLREVATNATMVDRADAGTIKCISPPLSHLVSLGVHLNGKARVRVTNNRFAGPHDRTTNALHFSYAEFAQKSAMNLLLNQESVAVGEYGSVQRPPRSA